MDRITDEDIREWSELQFSESDSPHNYVFYRNGYCLGAKAIRDRLTSASEGEEYNGKPCKGGCNCLEIAETKAGDMVKEYPCLGVDKMEFTEELISTAEGARSYLESEGIDVDKVVSEGLQHIDLVKENIELRNRIKELESLKQQPDCVELLEWIRKEVILDEDQWHITLPIMGGEQVSSERLIEIYQSNTKED